MVDRTQYPQAVDARSAGAQPPTFAPAAGEPSRGLGKAEMKTREEALRARKEDPDGPQNIHPDGEPCQTLDECESTHIASYFGGLLRPPFYMVPLRMLQAAYMTTRTVIADRGAQERSVIRNHDDDRSHRAADGSLRIIAGSIATDATVRAMTHTATVNLADYRYASNGNLVEAIRKEYGLTGKRFDKLSIMSHGTPGTLHSQNTSISVDYLLGRIYPMLMPGATLDLSGCNVAQTAKAREELQVLANRFDVRIIANGNLGSPLDLGAARHAYVFTPVH